MILCKNIYHSFKKSKFELHILDQTFKEKGISAFLGHNGSGKSTLFSLMSGLIAPKQGSIIFNNKNVFKNFEKIKTKIYLISWNINIYQDISGEDHIRFMRSLYKGNWSFDYEKKLKDELKIPLCQNISRLSRGEHAKLKVLLSLCIKPKLLLIDEITNELDISTKKIIYRKLDEYTFENDAQVFIATNNIFDMERYASQIVFLEKGQIQMNESLDSIKHRFKKIILINKSGSGTTKDINLKHLHHQELEWNGINGELFTDKFESSLLNELNKLGIEGTIAPYSLEEILLTLSNKEK